MNDFHDWIGYSSARSSASRFGKTLRFSSFNREEDLLSPINHHTLQRSSSWRAMATADGGGGLHGDDYVGIALPVDVTNMLHVTAPHTEQHSAPFG